MITSGCSISLSNKRKRFQEKIALVRRVDDDPFGRTQWTKFHMMCQHNIQKCAKTRVYDAACLRLVQVQAQTITSQERNVSRLCMPGGHVALANALQDGGIVECGAIPTPVPVVEALLNHLDQLGASTVQPHENRAGLGQDPPRIWG